MHVYIKIAIQIYKTELAGLDHYLLWFINILNILEGVVFILKQNYPTTQHL